MKNKVQLLSKVPENDCWLDNINQFSIDIREGLSCVISNKETESFLVSSNN